MAHVQHQQATGTLADRSPPPPSQGVLKLQPAPLKRHGSLQPQENDDDGESNEPDDSDKIRAEKPCRLGDHSQLKTASSQSQDDDGSLEDRRATTLLPELDEICELTRRLTATIQRNAQQENEGQDDDEAALLAHLYYQRAKALLQYAKYNASVHIPLELLELLDPQLVQSETVQCMSASDGWCAVKQAQSDALAAITSDPPDATGAYYVAAQSARSLGDSNAAITLVEKALQLTPQHKKLHSLLRKLCRETDAGRFVIAPPLLCQSASPSGDEVQQQQAHEEADEDEDAVLQADLTRRFQLMDALNDSPLLYKLESMQHESVHHQCATTNDARTLTAATNETVAFLRVLVFDDADATAQAIHVEASELHATAAQLTDAKRIIDAPGLRRWIVRTLAPAVVQSLPQSLTYEPLVPSSNRAVLVRDVLLTLTRLWLAMANLQRCTNVPHALAVSKLAHDLAKQLALDPVNGRDPLRRLEMACKDAYALALLDLAAEAGEALLLHQETLDKALQHQDRDRELVSRHLLARALLRMGEHDAARTEFLVLFQQSDAMGDSAMACLALYALGECQVAEGDVDEAMALFARALEVYHETAQCHGTWRKDSIQRAMDFYACLLRPTRRRPAMRRGSLAKPRKATLVVTPPLSVAMVEQDSAYWAWQDEYGEKSEDESTTRRRGAVWTTSAGMGREDTSAIPTPRRSLTETVIGGYTGDATSEPKAPVDREGAMAEDEDEGTEQEEEETVGPLTTLGVTLTSWLLGPQSTTSPTRPACCKPVE